MARSGGARSCRAEIPRSKVVSSATAVLRQKLRTFLNCTARHYFWRAVSRGGQRGGPNPCAASKAAFARSGAFPANAGRRALRFPRRRCAVTYDALPLIFSCGVERPRLKARYFNRGIREGYTTSCICFRIVVLSQGFDPGDRVERRCSSKVEQRICNPLVGGSSPLIGSRAMKTGNRGDFPRRLQVEGFPSGQREQTVNLPASAPT